MRLVGRVLRRVLVVRRLFDERSLCTMWIVMRKIKVSMELFGLSGRL